jgi:hypothetical protein
MGSIDIAVPNYNYGRYLDDCLDSILTQGVERLRVLVIDNASTDSSQAIARRRAAADPRIELRLRERNLGAHASFNDGIEWAQADYFAILCADDMLAPGALTRAIAVMEARPDVDMVFGETAFIGPDHVTAGDEAAKTGACEILGGPAFLEQFCRTGRSPVGGPTAVVRTTAQKRAGHYRTQLPHTDDVEMWMRLACSGNVARLDSIQVLARIHAGNQSAAVTNVHQWNLEMEKAFASFFSNEGRTLPEADRLQKLARESLAVRAYWCAVSHFLRGEPGVRELLGFAFTRRPSLAILPPLGRLLTRGDANQRIVATLRETFTRRRRPRVGRVSR